MESREFLKNQKLQEFGLHGTQCMSICNPQLSDDDGGEGSPDEQESIATIEKTRVVRPSRYKVLLHNDDYTTMEFVVFVLQRIFSKTFEESQKIMLHVHQEGVGVCGVFTHEIAESKAAKVTQMAKEGGHPLLCSIEPED